MKQFKIKKTKEKVQSVNKSLYIKKDLVEKLNKLAENNTSFNNVVISMIEYCLEE